MKDLFKSRILPAYDRMYTKATPAFDTDHRFSWKEMEKYSEVVDGSYHIPYNSFYLSKSDFEEILNKATNRLTSFWVWPHMNTTTIDKTIQNEVACAEEHAEIMKLPKRKQKEPLRLWREKYDLILSKMYQSKIASLDEDLANQKISSKEYNSMCNKLAKEYGLIKISPETNTIRICLTTGCAPTNDELHYQDAWNQAKFIEKGRDWSSVNAEYGEDVADIYSFYWRWRDSQ